MNIARMEKFEQLWAQRHDLPAESLAQYRFESREGYRLPELAAHYRTFCDVLIGGWQTMENCPMHKDVLFYREDAGVFTGQLTYCESFMSEKEVEESGLDEETLYLEDVFSFGPDGAYRCDGDLVPTHWMPFPSEPSE